MGCNTSKTLINAEPTNLNNEQNNNLTLYDANNKTQVESNGDGTNQGAGDIVMYNNIDCNTSAQIRLVQETSSNTGNARSILSPMIRSNQEKETLNNNCERFDKRPSTARKGFCTFDVILDDQIEATVLEDISAKPPPRRLKRLEPLENAPKLTSEMLAEKLERAEEKRRKNLASRQSGRSQHFKNESSASSEISNNTNEFISIKKKTTSISCSNELKSAGDMTEAQIMDFRDTNELGMMIAETKNTLEDLSDFCKITPRNDSSTNSNSPQQSQNTQDDDSADRNNNAVNAIHKAMLQSLYFKKNTILESLPETHDEE